MTTRIVTDANGRKHITNEPLLHPPQRTWVGLTDEEIKTLPQWFPSHESTAVMPLIRAFEAKLREKNT